jgi:hypothetical protein
MNLLMPRFGASEPTEEAMRAAFRRHRSQIEAIAREHLEYGWIEEGQTVLTTRFTVLNVEYGPELRSKPHDLQVAESMMRVLAELIGPGSSEVTVEFDGGEKDGYQSFAVHIGDDYGGITGLIGSRDLDSASRLRGRLAGLWGDFLQRRARKLIEQWG